MKRLVALLRLRCPRCLTGEVWRGLITMNDVCPDCGLRFEREPGYFTGAMVVSYVLAVPTLALLFVAVLALSGWPVVVALLCAEAVFVLLAPLLFRYSRVVWLHFDWLVDPVELER